MGERPGVGGRLKNSQLVPVHRRFLRGPALLCLWRHRFAAASGALRPNLFCRLSLSRRLPRREPALGLERRHAAEPGGGHRLAEDVVGDVAGGEHAFNAGRRRAGRGLNISVRLQRDLAAHQLGRGRVTDGDEGAVKGQILSAPVTTSRTLSRSGRAGFRRQNRLDRTIPADHDIRPAGQPLAARFSRRGTNRGGAGR